MATNDQEESVIREEYAQKRYLYEGFCREALRQLDQVIQQEAIALAFPIEHRVKALESILEKRMRMPLDTRSIADMRDIAGLRIIILFRRDIKRVTELIQNNFRVTHMEDVQARLEADRFGYASIHFEVQPREDWLTVPSWNPLAGLTGEIQLRTASQHIWATSSHLLQYKREANVPIPIRRAINRVAALLELVDLELDRVLDERVGYQTAVSNAAPQDNLLDVDVLRQALRRYLPAQNMDESDQLLLSELLDECKEFGVNTESQLCALLNKQADAMRKAEELALSSTRDKRKRSGYAYEPDRLKKGVYFTHVGLTRQALGSEFGQPFVEYVRKK
jgi:ppGpp synthetase/RelA/SpoT-type nucleotidyltranferase